MKRLILTILVCSLFSLSGCGSTTVVSVNAESEDIYDSSFGKSALRKIGDGLYYDSTTRIVYWWNGVLTYCNMYATTPSPFYAPNGLPYIYNPETNTFEEIEK